MPPLVLALYHHHRGRAIPGLKAIEPNRVDTEVKVVGQCYKQAVTTAIVQERLGHDTIVITLDTYSHVLLGLQEAAALLRFDEGLASRQAVKSAEGAPNGVRHQSVTN